MWALGPPAYLPSRGVGVDGDFAGTPAVAVHCGRHLLPMDQSFYLISRRHKLSAFGFLKRFVNEEGVFFHLSSWKLLPYPRRQTLTVSCQSEHGWLGRVGQLQGAADQGGQWGPSGVRGQRQPRL